MGSEKVSALDILGQLAQGGVIEAVEPEPNSKAVRSYYVPCNGYELAVYGFGGEFSYYLSSTENSDHSLVLKTDSFPVILNFIRPAIK